MVAPRRIRCVVCARVDLVLIAGNYTPGWAALRAYLDTHTRESFRAEKPIRKLINRLSWRRLFERAALADKIDVRFQRFLAAQACLDEAAAKEPHIRLALEWPKLHICSDFRLL